MSVFVLISNATAPIEFRKDMVINMDIQMIGIDHSKASIEYRESFSFTRHDAARAINQIIEWYPEAISGCVLLSTCNRTELYSSTKEDGVNAYGILCRVKGIDASDYS